ncbi:Gfo/Idh/MocA family oxidoreductase [Verrucomicrobiales bacterium]|nr:Gfo/Idh/MocA family oxidoreductase [Verrucomicrobiales bacterium]
MEASPDDLSDRYTPMNVSHSRRQVLTSALAASACHALSPYGFGQENLSVAVIGHTGRGNFGHGLDTLWLNLPETSIIAVSDPDEAGREKARKKLKLEESAAFAYYKVMLEKAAPHIAAVAPRHVDQHADMAVAAAHSPARGIYIEKPFCRDLAEADRIVTACKETNTKLAIAHRNRYHPVLPVIQDIVADGTIGQLLEIRLRGKEDQRGGLLDLWVLGSHLLNLAHYFAGNPTSCSANVYQDGRLITKKDVVEGSEGVGPLAGNEVHARWDTDSGTPIFFDSIQNAGTREAGFGLQLIGTKGIIDLRADREPLAHILSGNPQQPSTEPRKWVPITSAGIGKPEPTENINQLVGGHIAAAKDLIAAIEEDRPTLCNEEDGRWITEMTLGVFASHREGGKSVSLPLKNRKNAFADW